MTDKQYQSSELVAGFLSKNPVTQSSFHMHFLSKIKGMLYNCGLARPLIDERSHEVYHETYIKVLQKIQSNEYIEQGNFSAFFLGIAYNVQRTFYRKLSTTKKEKEPSHDISVMPVQASIIPEMVADEHNMMSDVSQNIFDETIAPHLDKSIFKGTYLSPEDKVTLHNIHQNFDRLSNKEQKIIIAYYRDGETIEEIANHLDLSQSSVKTTKHRGLRKLKIILQ